MTQSSAPSRSPRTRWATVDGPVQTITPEARQPRADLSRGSVQALGPSTAGSTTSASTRSATSASERRRRGDQRCASPAASNRLASTCTKPLSESSTPTRALRSGLRGLDMPRQTNPRTPGCGRARTSPVTARPQAGRRSRTFRASARPCWRVVNTFPTSGPARLRSWCIMRTRAPIPSCSSCSSEPAPTPSAASRCCATCSPTPRAARARARHPTLRAGGRPHRPRHPAPPGRARRDAQPPRRRRRPRAGGRARRHRRLRRGGRRPARPLRRRGADGAGRADRRACSSPPPSRWPPSLRGLRNGCDLGPQLVEIHRLENEADQIVQRARSPSSSRTASTR